MDVKAMDFPEASFDTVVDKATIDSVLVKFGLFSVEKIQLLMLIKWFRRSIECWVKMEFMWQFPMDSRNSVWRTLRSHNTSGVWKCSKSLSQRSPHRFLSLLTRKRRRMFITCIFAAKAISIDDWICYLKNHCHLNHHHPRQKSTSQSLTPTRLFTTQNPRLLTLVFACSYLRLRSFRCFLFLNFLWWRLFLLPQAIIALKVSLRL